MKRILLYFFAMLSLLSCETAEEVDVVVDDITISSTYLTNSFSAEKSTKTISFTSTTDWSISLTETTKAAPDWITISPMSGSSGDASITVTVAENTDLASRTAEATITAGEKSAVISISQAAFEPTLSLSSTSEDVDTTAGSFEVSLTSNVDWATSDIPEWITLNPTSGSGNKTITVTYAENTTIEKRVAVIKFSAIDYDNETEIVITQAAFEPTLSLSSTSESVSTTVGSFSLDVTSNIDWATSDIPEWITLNPTSGSGNSTISITYTENTTIEKRVATIKFKAANYDNETEIVITQAAFEPTLSLSSTSKDVDTTAGSFEVSLTSNTDWATSDIPEWITLNPTSGSGDHTVIISYMSNTGKEVRSATIIFTTAYNIFQSFTISQSAPQLDGLNDGGSL